MIVEMKNIPISQQRDFLDKKFDLWKKDQEQVDDVLVIGSNAMNLNSGTIKDKGTNTNSTITNSGAIGTAAGSITVVA